MLPATIKHTTSSRNVPEIFAQLQQNLDFPDKFSPIFKLHSNPPRKSHTDTSRQMDENDKVVDVLPIV
jgi:hypothetical protein